MIVVHTKTCKRCGADVPLRAGDVVGNELSTNCEGCGSKIHNSAIVALFAHACGFVGGGYISLLSLRAMEAMWGAPVAPWGWVGMFVVGLSAFIAIKRIVGGLCYAIYSLLRR